MGLLNLLSRAWNALPQGLRKFVGYGLAAGIAMCMVLFMFLFWGTGLIQEKLGIPTKLDVQAVQLGVSQRSEAELVAATEFTARYLVNQALDSLQQRNDSLFATLSRGLIEPGIHKLNTVEAQVRRLNDLLGVNNDLAREQAAAQRRTQDQIGTLQQQLTGTSTEAALERILRELQAVREEQDVLHQRLNKTSKQKF